MPTPSPTPRRQRILTGAALLGAAALALAAAVPVGAGRAPVRPARHRGASGLAPALAPFSPERPGRSLRLLFVHHSCGGQWLAPVGPDQGEHCIYRSHPNGGDLRARLTAEGYEVHEASYGSAIGERTDLFDWLPKFRDQMDRVLATAEQDDTYPAGTRNDVVMFKSCFPNNDFAGEGAAPGRAQGPELTVWNARAALTALLPYFARHPEVLFVYVTAPPLAPAAPPQRAWRWLLDSARGRPSPRAQLEARAAWARQFNDWVRAPDGWLRDYAGCNVVVFDYYDVLTAEGRSDLSMYATERGEDSHPSSEGNRRATEAFVPLLNRAVRRAGLAP